MSENYCDICDCNVNFKHSYSKQQHLQGKMHQKMLRKKNVLQKDTAEYFMKNYDSLNSQELSKKEKRIIKKAEKSELEKYGNVPVNVVKCLSASTINSLNQFTNNELLMNALKMLDDKRFIPILQNNADNVIDILKAIYVYPSHLSIAEAFEIFYNHNEMRIYFVDLCCKAYELPFSTRHKMYKLSRNGIISVICPLFKRYVTSKIPSNEKIIDKINQVYDYEKISNAIDNGNVDYAQFQIQENYNNNAAYNEQIFCEARELWNSHIRESNDCIVYTDCDLAKMA